MTVIQIPCEYDVCIGGKQPLGCVAWPKDSLDLLRFYRGITGQTVTRLQVEAALCQDTRAGCPRRRTVSGYSSAILDIGGATVTVHLRLEERDPDCNYWEVTDVSIILQRPRVGA